VAPSRYVPPLGNSDHLVLHTNSYPLLVPAERSASQSFCASDQTVGGRKRGGPPGTARRAQLLDSMLLAQTEQPRQGQRRLWRRHREYRMGEVLRADRHYREGFSAPRAPTS